MLFKSIKVIRLVIFFEIRPVMSDITAIAFINFDLIKKIYSEFIVI